MANDVTRNGWLNAPLWLAAALGVTGMIAVTQLHARPADQPAGVATTVTLDGRAYTSAGANAVRYDDDKMAVVGTGEGGIQVFRNVANQAPMGGGGGGKQGTASKPVPSRLYFIKTGDDMYLPLRPVNRPE